MKFTSFSQLFGKNRARRASHADRAHRRPAASHRLLLETLEDRTLPSTLPAVTVGQQIDISNLRDINATSHADQANENTPSVAVDPRNPNVAAVAYIINDAGLKSTVLQRTYVGAAITTDHGQHWTSIPGTSGGGFSAFDNILDPNTLTSATPSPYLQVASPSVGFDFSQHLYILMSENNVGLGQSTGGALVLEKYDVSSGKPVQLITDNVVYQWVQGQDPALNPTMAVDSNVSNFTDGNNFTQSDPFSGNVYVAWNTNAKPPFTAHPPDPNFNPASQRIVVSSDGGQTFGPQMYLNQNYNLDGTQERDGAVQLAISQGTPNKGIPGGEVFASWANFNNSVQPPPAVTSNSTVEFANALGGATQVFNGPSGTINNDTVTPFTINNVTITAPGFTSVSNIEVQLVLTYPNLSQLKIELVAPNGTAVTLVDNRLDEQGNTRPGNPGIAGQDMGILNLQNNTGNIGTVFDTFAPRAITDSTVPASNYIGYYQPEANSTHVSPLLNAFFGLDKNDPKIHGNWTLRITDFHGGAGTNPPPQVVS